MSSVETVDIIIPNFNKAIYIEETIQSVIDQKFDNWKLYIIDNNSSDGSIKILKKFDNFKNKIKIIYLKRNKGAYFSRNLGLRISSSKYVCFLDSGDIWKDDKRHDAEHFSVSEHAYDHGVCLPSFAALTEDQILYVCKIIKEYYR